MDPNHVTGNYRSSKCKPIRPFKAYMKAPLSMTLDNLPVDLLMQDSTQTYAKFRNKTLTEARDSISTNKNMRRAHSQCCNVDKPLNWEQRKKKNLASQKSRDDERAKFSSKNY